MNPGERSMTNDDTFFKVTNQHIYDKLIEIEAHVIKTNGRVTKNEEDIKWMRHIGATTVTIIIGVVLWLVKSVVFR